jgi:hypothetical protein
MKLFLILLFFSPSVFAIELVLNGMTYHISNYAIHNNGQKIVIDHKGVSNNTKANCKTPDKRSSTNYRYVKNYAPQRKPAAIKPKKNTGGAFGRLLDELDSIRSGSSNEKKKQNYQ